MHEVLVAGAGKIGALIATLLAESSDYQVHVVDKDTKSFDWLNENIKPRLHQKKLDLSDLNSLHAYIKQHSIKTIISCLPYFCNIALAEIAREYNLNYFDLTEDVKVSEKIKSLAKGASSIFSPHCGLAPGFISIAANALMQGFSEINEVLMRVGALPIYPNNALKYSLNWSTEGLINEYGNLGFGIVDKQEVIMHPLEGLESITIDGLVYEAFNTSGGLGTLADSYVGKVQTMNYKTLRYPGHCERIAFLMKDLKLNDDRETLKHILERALPRSREDVVIIYVAVNGHQDGQFIEETFVQKIYPKNIANKMWSAIQVTTAASACCAVDILLSQSGQYKGWVTQESIALKDFMNNRFGQYYNG